MDTSRHHGGIEELLRLIHSARNTLITTFNEKSIQGSPDNSGDILKLVQARALIRTREGYRINPKLAAFIHHYLDTETSRYLNTEHAARIPQIRELATEYLDAKYQSNGYNKRSETALLEELEAIVYELITDLIDAKSRLHSRVVQDFGYAQTLEAKAIENQRTLTQANELVLSLKEFTTSMLTEIAADDRKLTELLCLELPKRIAECQADLELTIDKLRSHLLTFRVKQRDKKLVHAFDAFFTTEHAFALDIDDAFSEVACEKTIDAKHFLITPVPIYAYANLTDYALEDTLDSIAQQVLETPIEFDIPQTETSIAGPQDLTSKVEPEQSDPLNDACDSLLAHCILNNEEISATEYFDLHIRHSLDISKDAWLFMLLSYYNSLTEEHANLVGCTPIGDHYLKNKQGNLHITDIAIRPL
ncbi:hypothetical protein [Vibrio superstes]|uniref:Uncharacterized protein n=1 Tax=Vibrio superstes NBRC 103154 TaxID=1219062 RepID=A0A511QVR2_9VIBR|nr:hypothetical protein [Vibrio superstes]GEM80836.1 hypothetical protein VSU01S_30810 [Vibrio superstes NBRC 103154]